MEQFNHHVYEPTSNLDQTIIIPLSRRTEEIFGGIYSQRIRANSTQNAREPPEGDCYRNGTDVAMQNVLSWSLAKNYDALEVPGFGNANYLGSAVARRSNSSNASSRRESNGERSLSSFNRDTNAMSLRSSIDDYVKDVPIELFTVSKMVVNVPTNKEVTTQ